VPSPADANPGLEPGLAAALNQELVRHGRLLHVLKAQMATLVPEGLDTAAFSLLLALVRCGPTRQGELAGRALLDPSTVSRYVAQLARAGYAQRRPDPQDGRAVQLVPTDAGRAVATAIGERRQAMITQALAGWNAQDLAALVRLLTRLNDDLDAFRPHIERVLVGPSDPEAPAGQPRADVPDPRSPDQESS
jgi:DNA-binding MarR family transcriptional regulator